ncbi:MAG: hypothetical protein ACLUT5_14495 [Butyricicoccus sp.]
MAPVRAICEALGFKVTWNADRSININNGKCSPICALATTAMSFILPLRAWPV